ncbi:suppressor of cytokine signaling 2 isoform X2 [Microtus oregoni]|uniref:suppressor of cytokine signaling 2 isoform X2 n=1 Tax=Microtus oregoni TaxID=111838 RepID=UPI001BB19C48|nr:suppressor of cytokine signaling 2 isoform X2 [Microtus oregoni]
MTLRCLEPSGNGADRTRSQWGTAGSAEEQSPEAARLAKALRELSQTGWYWGSMTVNEAKEKLKETPEGTFLIRDSSHSDYLLTISVKTSAGPTNLRIEYQEGKFRLDSIICVKSKLKQFDSVVHLIDYYVQMCKDKRTGPEAPRNGTVHLYLTKPLYTSAPSLQHFCRLTINKCTGAIWGLPLPTRLKDYLEDYKFQGPYSGLYEHGGLALCCRYGSLTSSQLHNPNSSFLTPADGEQAKACWRAAKPRHTLGTK